MVVVCRIESHVVILVAAAVTLEKGKMIIIIVRIDIGSDIRKGRSDIVAILEQLLLQAGHVIDKVVVVAAASESSQTESPSCIVLEVVVLLLLLQQVTHGRIQTSSTTSHAIQK